MRKSSLVLVAAIFAAACGSSTNLHDSSTDTSPTEPAATSGATTTPPAAPPPAATPPAAPVDAGADPDDPYGTPVQCSSGTHWTNGDQGSAAMKPGSACRTCHFVGGKASSKSWDIAGTVYATAHEPDDCNGSNTGGAVIVITDANGKDIQLPVNSVGNFWHNDTFGFAPVAKPYHAKIVANGKTRKMSAAQTDGNCNSCHTESGDNSAPGRIMLP